MQINRRSWHYRYLRVVGPGSFPSTLCGYVWLLFFTLTIVPVILIIASPFILARATFELLLPRFLPRRGYRPPRPPSLLLEWLRAKKRRICPLVECTE